MSTTFFPALIARNSEVFRWMWQEFELVWDFIAVPVTCEFDDDPNKNEGAIVSTFSPLEAYGKNFRRSRASNSKASSPIWAKIELVQDFMSDYLQVWWRSYQK